MSPSEWNVLIIKKNCWSSNWALKWGRKWFWTWQLFVPDGWSGYCKNWIHPVGSQWWFNGAGNIFVIVLIEHCLNLTAYSSIVADHCPSFYDHTALHWIWLLPAGSYIISTQSSNYHKLVYWTCQWSKSLIKVAGECTQNECPQILYPYDFFKF